MLNIESYIYGSNHFLFQMVKSWIIIENVGSFTGHPKLHLKLVDQNVQL